MIHIHFLKELRIFIQETEITSKNIFIDFYAPGCEDMYRDRIKKMHLENIIKIHNRIPYHKVIEEMYASDLLLLFQGPTCDIQIPAKFFEYLRVGKPILALTTMESETAQLVNQTGSGRIVTIDNPIEIANELKNWYFNGSSLPVKNVKNIQLFSRKFQTRQLAEGFNNILNNFKITYK